MRAPSLSAATLVLGFLATSCAVSGAAAGASPGSVHRRCISDPEASALGYSVLNATTGGRVLWLAGASATKAQDGRSLKGDFEGQTREAFRMLQQRLVNQGGGLQDIVSMTVYVTSPAHNAEFVAIRKQLFDAHCYPASALVIVSGLADPAIQIEIQAIAVLPE